MKKSKKNKIKKQKNWDQILLIVLLIGTILCFVFSIALYLIGIQKILPVVLIFGVSSLSSLIIFLLSKETLSMKNKKDHSKELKTAPESI